MCAQDSENSHRGVNSPLAKPRPGVTLEVSVLPIYQRDLQAERILTRSPDVTKDPVWFRSKSLHPRAVSISLVCKISQALDMCLFLGVSPAPSLA